MTAERIDIVIVGAGQAGLAAGYWLRGRDLLIVDGADQIGAAWANRWDSMRLFTPASFTHLPGRPFPRPARHLPSKDEMAAYLRDYAAQWHLPVRLGWPVTRVVADAGGYLVQSGEHSIVAQSVVIATGPAMAPRVPDFAAGLAVPTVHATDYRNPSQLPDGPVLVAGAGNSGAEIALDLAPTRRVWLAGRPTGRFPFAIGGPIYRAMNRLLTADTRLGQALASSASGKGTPLVRVRDRDLHRAGVTRAPAVTGTDNGNPRLADGQVLDVAAVVWCTGYQQDYSWLDLGGEPTIRPPRHERGVVTDHPGLYFLGLPFQYSMASSLVGGVGPDAEYIAARIKGAVTG